MTIDPENAVVRLCVAGVEAEAAGRGDEAAALYALAWDARTDDGEASIAAHYLARVQDDPVDRRAWNVRALEHAQRSEAAAFLPSLYLNLGHSYEELGDPQRAANCYAEAEAALHDLPAGPATDALRAAIARARSRAPLGPP